MSAAQSPLLSPETRQRIAAEVAKYPKARTALLPSLKLAQHEIGYLPPAAIAEVAEIVGVSHAQANELTTFYSMLRSEPSGRRRVEVCVQLPCALVGAERLLKQLSKALGVAPGETSEDDSVTLIRTPECLGACHRAPMCLIDEEYVENLTTPEAVAAVVVRIKAESAEVRA